VNESTLPPHFYSNPPNRAALSSLAITGCPHCHSPNFLNSHGNLWGFEQGSFSREVRGKRILCSTRGRHKGCGKTFSILSPNRLYRHSVSTPLLCFLFTLLLAGIPVLPAWNQTLHHFSAKFCQSTGYKILARLRGQHTQLRVRILSACPPPIRILPTAYPNRDDPITEFQIHFQTSFMRPTGTR